MRYEEFTIEGRNAVREAFRSGKTIDKLYVQDGCQDGPIVAIKKEAKKQDTIIRYVTRERLDQMSGTGRHQGVIAMAAAYEYATVDEILQTAKAKQEPPFLILLDNIFPHHTNEIAQSEAYLGHKWCNYWFHVHHLNDKAGKMSKSKGEFLTVSLLKSKGYDPRVYRLFCLQSHYRKPLEFSFDALDNAGAAYDKLVKRIGSLQKGNEKEVDQEKFAAYKARFEEALGDDLNSSMALTVIYDMLKDDMSDATKYALAEDFDRVLSLDLTTAYAAKEAEANGDVDAAMESYILEKIEERKAAKKAKDFARADEIRAELLEKGIVLEDTREGVKWKRA